MPDKTMQKNAARGPEVRRAGIVFLSEGARRMAARVLEFCAGQHVLLAAPEELLAPTWLQAAGSSARLAGWECWPTAGIFRNPLRSPLDFLAQIDTLWVIVGEAGVSTRGPQAMLDAMTPGLQELLFIAQREGVPTYCRDEGGAELEGWLAPLEADPELAERLDAAQTKRLIRMDRLGVLRLRCDIESGPMWDARDMGVSANSLDVPLPLLRRTAAWQRRFESVAPHWNELDEDDGIAWLQAHQNEGLSLAVDLQAALSERGLTVQLWLGPVDGWVAVADLRAVNGDKWGKD